MLQSISFCLALCLVYVASTLYLSNLDVPAINMFFYYYRVRVTDKY